MNLRERYRESYLKCWKLLKEGSRNEVRDILLKDANTLEKHLEQLDATDPDREFCRMYLSLVLTQIGTMYIETEEFSKGINFLKKCLDLNKGPLVFYPVYTSMEARTRLGYALLRQSELEEALKFLKESEKIYYDFRAVKDVLAPQVYEDMKDIPGLGEEELELTHTMTMFYLAQAYEVMKDYPKSSVYCHETLKRQLTQKNFDPIDWALNSATLSQFFMDRMLFKQGRHHLAAASHVLDEYENKLKNEKNSQKEMGARSEEFRHRSADLSWCWAKYGAIILQHSRYKLSNSKDDVDENQGDLESLFFDGLDLTRYENHITDEDVVAFEDAREVFLFSQRHLNKAKEYYTLEDRASKHVQIVRDHSLLFRLLSAFEPDEKRQFKMLKKRANMLEVVLKELNPRYYMDLCRELWFEVGEVYHDMMGLKSQKAEEASNPQTFKQINSLIESSIKNFSHFLDSTKDKKTGELPDPIEEDLIMPILSAHFYLGRLHVKYETVDKPQQAEHTKKAYDFFKYFVDYCDKNEKAKAIVGEKYQLSKKLIMVLQLSLLKLTFDNVFHLF